MICHVLYTGGGLYLGDLIAKITIMIPYYLKTYGVCFHIFIIKDVSLQQNTFKEIDDFLLFFIKMRNSFLICTCDIMYVYI